MCRLFMRLKSRPIGQSFMTIAGIYKDELSGQFKVHVLGVEHQESLVFTLFQVKFFIHVYAEWFHSSYRIEKNCKYLR